MGNFESDPKLRWRLVKRALKWLAISVVALVIVFLLTPLGRYVARAAWEEGFILARRREIAVMVADSTVPRHVRERLQLVLDARRYARDVLGLEPGESFTTYSQLKRDTLVLVLSAARRDTLKAHTWWFPVVGRFPYKGFFDFDEARETARRMEEEGFDTYIRPASAFSTLGWFNDPLLSTSLRQDSLQLVNTVIHELVHNTFFLKGKVEFNESFANLIGARGAADFFRARGEYEAARAAELDWADDKLLASFWAATVDRVDSVFAIPGRDSLWRVAARDTVYALMRRVLLEDLAPRMSTVPRAALERIVLNNASLLARRVYSSGLWEFDEVHRRYGGTLRETFERIVKSVEGSEEPFEAMMGGVAR